MGEWHRVRLGDVAPFQYGKGLVQSSRESHGDIPVYGSSGLTGYHTEAITEAPVIIIGRKGTVGSVFLSPVPVWPIDTTFFTYGSPDTDIVYLYYLMLTLGLNYMNSDSAVPGLNRDRAHSIKFPLPPLPEQRAIAHILGSLDDKIEANRRMNETLEATARAIFKSWFVDFDPVVAKMRGETPAGMDAETAALFPDALVESALGLIPRGWKVVPIGDHVNANKGLSYKGAYLVDSIEDGIPMHNLNSVNEWGTYKFDGIKFYAGEYKSRHEVRPGDLIVANTEQGFDLLLIASPAIVPATFGDKGIISHHIYDCPEKRSSMIW